MIHQALRLTCLITLAASCWATPSLAFDTLDGDRAQWRANPSFSVANAPPEIGLANHRVAVRAAFDAWTDVAGSSLEFEQQNDNGDIPVQYLGNWPREFGEFAAGITNTGRRGGRITSARISLNGEHFDWSTNGEAGTSDVQGVTTHEVGHALGLGHSFYREATMYWTGDAGDDLSMRTLAPDDVRGARYLYGEGGEGRVCDTCEDNDDCAAGGLCLGLEPDHSFCGQPCQNGRCPENTACFELQGGGTQCAPLARVCSDDGAGEFEDGDYCFGSDQCGGGRMCYPTADSAQCATVCTPGRDRCARGRCVPLGGEEIPGLCLVGGDVPFGAACEDHTDCSTTLCLPIDEESSVCSQSCDPDADDCPAGLCVETMDPMLPAVCIPPGEGAFGAPCESNLDCASSMCVPLSDDSAVCASPCDPSQQRCPGGRCFETEDADTPGICLPLGDAAYGAVCDSDLECVTGLCLPLSDDLAVCTQECDIDADDCPGGRCVDTGSPALPAVCVPPGDVAEGGRCGTAERRCEDGLTCIGDAGDEACRAACAPFGECGAGYGCSPFSADFWLCLPSDGPMVGAVCDEVCAGGLLCLPIGEDEPNLCVQPCFPGGGDCGEGLCFELIEGLGVCPTGETVFGQPCESHLDCLSTLCIPGEDGGVCSRTCADDRECGDGWLCQETQSRGRVCFPDDGAAGEGGGGLQGIGDLPGFGGSAGGGGERPPPGMGGAPGTPAPGTGGQSGGIGGAMGGTSSGTPIPMAVSPVAAEEDGLFGCDANPNGTGAGLPFWLLLLAAGRWRIRKMNVRLESTSSVVED